MPRASSGPGGRLETGIWTWGHLSPWQGISAVSQNQNYERLLCALPTPKPALHMSPVNNAVYLAAARTGEAETYP